MYFQIGVNLLIRSFRLCFHDNTHVLIIIINKRKTQKYYFALKLRKSRAFSHHFWAKIIYIYCNNVSKISPQVFLLVLLLI